MQDVKRALRNVFGEIALLFRRKQDVRIDADNRGFSADVMQGVGDRWTSTPHVVGIHGLG
jgi:hypothetical protein